MTITERLGFTAPPASRTRSGRIEKGRTARKEVPRSRHGAWQPAADRPDPIETLLAQERVRVPDLVPIRRGRMVASAFAFFRGAAAVMAADLGPEPRSGLEVQLCGDAHLVNFGGFASPEREMVFDLNDFDETLPGPFEWDVKRLAASLEVAGRDRGLDLPLREAAVRAGVRTYRQAVREFSAMRAIDVWYAKLDASEMLRRWGDEAGRRRVRNVGRMAAKAESKNHLKAFNKLTRIEGGKVRFVSDPPLLEPASEVYSGVENSRIWDTLLAAFQAYRDSLPGPSQVLFDRYRFVDLARKVVGVGSVGTRCWVALLVGDSEQDPLFLQVKEAEASVLEAHLDKSRFDNHGRRVVEGQRAIQAASDVLLGWCTAPGPDGVPRDFYLRQLWDWKISASIDTMPPRNLQIYAEICGWTLARAHARTGDATAIGAYLGSGTAFDRSMVSFAQAYADQNARDHRALTEAIAAGRLSATAGI